MANSKKKGSSFAMGLLLLLIPSLLVTGVLAYQSYSRSSQVFGLSPEPIFLKPDDKTIVSKQPVMSETLAVASDRVPFLIRTAPTNIELKALPRKAVYAQVNINSSIADMSDSNSIPVQADVSEQSSENFEPLSTQPSLQGNSNQLQSNTNLLKGLDLTELSPELAWKLESMIDDEKSTPEPVNSRPARSLESPVIELESHGSRLSGVLPKLDLQTHMYSSSKNKRWVKVNGHEVAQGDWIGQDIQLLEIKPQSIIIEFNQQKIEIPALYEWKG
jgi:general secretion pathway protein B